MYYRKNKYAREWILLPHIPNGSAHFHAQRVEFIPLVAREKGLKTMVGAWIGADKEQNEKEIEALIDLANARHVDIAAIGNEVLLRDELSEQEILQYIGKVKEALPDIPVGYVDAYYQFYERPNLVEACDVILANCYPFWEGCDLDYALLYMKDMYHRALRAGGGKKAIISEAGWPGKGTSLEGAFPSFENAIKYFINTQKWSKEEDIAIFYFSSFDESWKVGDEGDVGAFWGLWDKYENIKY